MTIHMSTAMSYYPEAMHHSICRSLRSLLGRIQFYRFPVQNFPFSLSLTPLRHWWQSLQSRQPKYIHNYTSAQVTQWSAVKLIWNELSVLSSVGSNSCSSQSSFALTASGAKEIGINNFFSLLSIKVFRANEWHNDSYSHSAGTRNCSVITVNTSTNLDYLVFFFCELRCGSPLCVFRYFLLFSRRKSPNLYFHLFNHTQASLLVFGFVVLFSVAIPFAVILESFSVSSHGSHWRVHFVKWNVRCWG